MKQPPRSRLSRKIALKAAVSLSAMLFFTACGGGSAGYVQPVPLDSVSLSVADVQRILAQGVAEAKARNLKATLAVTDRVGNVLAVYRMSGAATTVDVLGGRGITGGLDGLRNTIPDTSAAISKAITGAYLSSSGNAFSSRTASQIVQENFNPREANQPSGPLFGVQFSQLPCSDLVNRMADGDIGPKHSPLGLSADPGGLPLYKGGVVVGGIGVMADGVYGLDPDITDIDSDVDELVAVAASTGYSAPLAVRANRITADGRSFRYVDSESIVSSPAQASVASLLPAEYVAVAGYSTATPRAGVAMGKPGSGIEPDITGFAAQSGWLLTDGASLNRFPLRNSVTPAVGSGGITQAEATQLLHSALDIANRARAQIRQPLGSSAQVSITVVDAGGEILGLVRTPDAPLFGLDVAVQKARTAAFFSSTTAAADLNSLPPASYVSGLVGPTTPSPITAYVTAAQNFFGNAQFLADGTAFSARAVGNIHRPTYPDGIASSPNGPLSQPMSAWSPFNVGLQLDLVYNKLVSSVAAGDLGIGCTGLPTLKNGIQIFPGAVPVYRGMQLVGAIGVSGDGVDQDDMVALLGLARAQAALRAVEANPVGNAPASLRADNLQPMGVRLRYAQCPQSPFNNSTEQNVCAGL